MHRQRGLGDGRHPMGGGSRHEIADIGAAIERPIGAERLVGGDDGDMRRIEQREVAQRLAGIGGLVAARDPTAS